MRFLFNVYLNISRCSVTAGRMSLSRYVNDHTVSDTGRNFHFNDFFSIDDSFSAACLAFILYDGSFSAACRAHSLSLHHAENALLSFYHEPVPVACGTCFGSSAPFGATSVTVIADYFLFNFEFLCDSGSNFLKIHFYFQTQVTASVLWFAGAAAASESSESATVSEYVSEHGEDVIHVHAATTETSGSIHTFVSELIIPGALLRIPQDIVGFCCFLKFSFRLFVVRIAVGVILDGHFLIGLFYLIVRGVFCYAKHFIVIAFRHIVIRSLESYCHLCMAYDFLVQCVACFYAIKNLALQVVCRSGELGNGLVQIDIEVCVFRLNLFYTLLT